MIRKLLLQSVDRESFSQMWVVAMFCWVSSFNINTMLNYG